METKSKNKLTNEIGKIVYSPEINSNTFLTNNEENDEINQESSKFIFNSPTLNDNIITSKIVSRSNSIMNNETQLNLGSIECCSIADSNQLNHNYIEAINEDVKKHDASKTNINNVDSEIKEKNDESKNHEIFVNNDDDLINSKITKETNDNNNTIKKSPQTRTFIRKKTV